MLALAIMRSSQLRARLDFPPWNFVGRANFELGAKCTISCHSCFFLSNRRGNCFFLSNRRGK